MDKYTKKYIRLIKQVKTDQELSDIIDKIYTDGFDDGEQTYINPPQKKPLTESEDRYRKKILNLIEDMETDDDISPITIPSILKQGSKGYL